MVRVEPATVYPLRASARCLRRELMRMGYRVLSVHHPNQTKLYVVDRQGRPVAVIWVSKHGTAIRLLGPARELEGLLALCSTPAG